MLLRVILDVIAAVFVVYALRNMIYVFLDCLGKEKEDVRQTQDDEENKDK